MGLGERYWTSDNVGQIPKGVPIAVYDMPLPPAAEIHSYLQSSTAAVLRGQEVARTLQQVKWDGFVPDLIYAHPGWGEALYVKDVFPDVPLINFCEFYYHSTGQDVGFDPEYPSTFDDILQLRTRNAPHLLSLDAMDAGISPTKWQRSCFPVPYQSRIEVVHDGIDTYYMSPDPNAVFVLPSRKTLSAQDEVITFVNRNLEPSRGFHTFMRALPELLQRRPNAQILIVGGDEVSYGQPSAYGSYRKQMLAELGDRLDLSRIHFLGKIPYSQYRRMLQISTAHVYLTYPFVLSWSMLEAMAVGCLVIGSRTTPVTEVIADESNGLLVDFFSPDEIVNAVCRACEQPEQMAELRRAARQTVLDHYDLHSVCLPRQTALLEQLLR
jgi:glycosyltransferase involved in cell wall biosynthesis